jgi:hypothetical protein
METSDVLELDEQDDGGAASGLLALLPLGAAAALFVSLFLPWLGLGGQTQSGWSVPLGAEFGLVALAAVLVELLAFAGAWTNRAFELVAFCLIAAAGLLGVSAVANLRWGLQFNNFSLFQYGAWVGLALAIVLVCLAALRLVALRRSAP